MKYGVLARMGDRRSAGTKSCVSLGIAALVPDAIRPGAVLVPKSDLTRCDDVSLLRRDMHYTALRPRVETEGFVRVAVIENGEHWMRSRNVLEVGAVRNRMLPGQSH